MRTQTKVNLVQGLVGAILLLLLYIRINNYYQLTRRWVTTYTNQLRFYISSLWILAVLMIIIMIVFFVYSDRSQIQKNLVLTLALLVVGTGVVFQFLNQPDYTREHVTPIPLSTNQVIQKVYKSKYSSYEDGFYFYNPDSGQYKQIKKEVRRYSLSSQTDLYSVNMKMLHDKLGEKRYKQLLKKVGIKSNNAIIFTYRDDGVNRVKTFNRLEDRQVLLRFVHYLNGDETVNFY
ncbi:hypothetical protein [Pediococcus ethanolidurans]|uniref:hypothetical protein n=2 Tax=Pediococcus ethanolidurans TaxID=319653 RepID=UPI001C1ECDD0|nr:hypothetical protein [Pediococcus ethanolidurans]MBU7555280.1 hypothetical protein [Pediococcus ethanolidurans]MCT4398310.1 hypothetical protein [Pediococcus ethanolidurans]MCV3322490.1 hypothetical protein [Pediococcus ethanolidurans]MCV3555316.1 hypothetical protein [Pediococcus ethanolidurans]